MAQSRKVTEKDSIQMREVKIRFVYENEIKGAWVNGLMALQNGFMTAHYARRAIRIEFELEEKPPRIRASVNG